MAGLKVITPPAVEPVTLADIKPQLRIDVDDTSYDNVLKPLISAAREDCEAFQNRSYITQTLELALDDWPCDGRIELHHPPLQSVTSVVYVDHEGTETTWDSDNYLVDDYAFVAAVVKKKSIYWPTVCLAAANGIRVRYVAGYPPGDTDPAANVPQAVKQAIILYAMAMFDTPGCPMPDAVKHLLWKDRVMPL